MTRDETKKIIMIICATYPNFKPDNLTQTVDAWHFFLSDYPYETISMALKAYVTGSASGFAPSASELIATARRPSELSELNDMEAWGLVSKALRNGTYHSKEEFEKLPINVQKAVGSPTQLYIWATDDGYNESVTMSLFQRAYKNVLSRNRDIEAMPPEMRLQVNERLRIE